MIAVLLALALHCPAPDHYDAPVLHRPVIVEPADDGVLTVSVWGGR